MQVRRRTRGMRIAFDPDLLLTTIIAVMMGAGKRPGCASRIDFSSWTCGHVTFGHPHMHARMEAKIT